MVMSTFFVLKREWSSWEHLVETIKIVSLSWNLSRLIARIRRIQWRCSVFLFLLCYYLFWTNMVQKIKIARLNWNLVPKLIRICKTQRCSQFICFRLEIPFLRKFGPKNQNCLLKLKFEEFNSNMKNSIVVFTLSVFEWKYPL